MPVSKTTKAEGGVGEEPVRGPRISGASQSRDSYVTATDPFVYDADGSWKALGGGATELPLPTISDGKGASATPRSGVVRYKLKKPKPNNLSDNESVRSLPLRGYQEGAYLTGPEATASPSIIDRRRLRNAKSHMSIPVGMPTEAPGRLRRGSGRTVSIEAQRALHSRSQEAITHTSSSSNTKQPKNKGKADAEPRTSTATTLADFPVPPMHNPINSLPMLIARASTDDEVAAAPVEALIAAFRNVSVAVNGVQKLLDATRTRGQELPDADWENMSAFERSWRMSNEDILLTIYGRRDSWLSSADVAHVDSIAAEVAACPGVLGLFLAEDSDIF
jgi:hypothetical protein